MEEEKVYIKNVSFSEKKYVINSLFTEFLYPLQHSNFVTETEVIRSKEERNSVVSGSRKYYQGKD